MALHEAGWRGRQAGPPPSTGRFFAWAPPTVSLGYGQPLDGDVSVEACRRLGVGLVRRPTGGSAIYHDGPERELTYSVVATTDDLGGARDLGETYRWIARALVAGLRALGAPVAMVAVARGGDPTPAFCFARTGSYEIEIAARKVVGSAQRRHGRVARRPRVSREYPAEPRVGVGAVVLDGDRVLLVKRGRPPALGKWSLPGGLVHLGETTRDAVLREVAEECGLAITVAGVAGVGDRVTRDAAGRVKYHYVLVDYLAYPESTRLTSGSDAAEARWVEIDRVAELDTTDGLVDMIRRAQTLRGGARA